MSTNPKLLLSSYVDTVRTVNPLIHCFANYVSMDITANILLAAGASPAMVHAVNECGEFTAFSNGLCINIGTLDNVWIESMKISASKASTLQLPWVLDPVGCGATALRTDTSYTLANDYKPAAIRGNGSEIIALYTAAIARMKDTVGTTPSTDTMTSTTTKGVDSTVSSNQALQAGLFLSKHVTQGLIIVSGATDYVIAAAQTRYNSSSKDMIIGITSGTPLLTKITATGCSLSALIAAFLAIVPKITNIPENSNPYIDAAVAACAFFGAAADTVVAKYEKGSTNGGLGPGTLRVEFIDQLYLLPSTTVDKVKVEVCN